jgi:threonine-phosphate decarboxylase
MKVNNIHGGDTDVVSRLYGIDKADIKNFSGNVNPLGLPQSVRDAIINNPDVITGYPDVSYVELRAAIAEYTGTDSENIIVGNGSTELISGFIKTVSPKKAVIVSPAYSEYQREIELTGGSVVLFELEESEDFKLNTDKLKKALTSDIDLLVICNPNNPTGSYVSEEQASEILTHCEQNGIYTMIDETYIEFADEDVKISAVPLADKFKKLFITRGTSKFFACPGLRLGYGICSDKDIISKINTKKDPWSVNSFAELCGKTMFTDTEFEKKTKAFITGERNKIKTELSKWKNIKLYDTQSNFFLFKLLRDDITSSQIFENLIRDGLLVRDASDFPYLGESFIRFCILLPEDNSRLINKLYNIIEK